MARVGRDAGICDRPEDKEERGGEYWEELQAVWKEIAEICRRSKNTHSVDERFFIGIDRVNKEAS